MVCSSIGQDKRFSFSKGQFDSATDYNMEAKKEKNELRKIIFKTKGATIVLFRDIPYWNASIRVKALKRIYNDWRGEFIITR